MIGMVLGLGFQWWTQVTQPWQYIAFIFVYIDIIDYWIDYAPSLKKFPPKKEIDIILDMVIMFNLFLYIFSTQKTAILYFVASFILMRILDNVWLWRASREYPLEKNNLKKWSAFNIAEIVFGLAIFLVAIVNPSVPIPLLIITAVLWLGMRIFSATRFKKAHLL